MVVWRVAKWRQAIIYWLPLVLWMALIYTGSADTRSAERTSLYLEPLVRWALPWLSDDGVQLTMLIIRKCGHLTEYAVLAVLAWRAVRGPVKQRSLRWSWAQAGLALLVVILYAASDEWHQLSVPTRQGTYHDVLIDTCGGALGLAAAWTVTWLRGRNLKPEPSPNRRYPIQLAPPE